MANVDPTFDNTSPMKVGNHFVVTGTIAVTSTAGESRLGKDVLWCHMNCTTDDATNDLRLTINEEDDFSTASQGLVAHQSEAASDTYRFTAGVLL